MTAAQWVSVPPVAYFPKEISARAIRWLQPSQNSGTQDWLTRHTFLQPRSQRGCEPRSLQPVLIRMISRRPIITTRWSCLSKKKKQKKPQGLPGVNGGCSALPNPRVFGARHAWGRVQFAWETASCQEGWGYGTAVAKSDVQSQSV